QRVRAGLQSRRNHATNDRASAPEVFRQMARPARLPDERSGHDHSRTFFVTSSTAGGRSLFQTERMASLFIDVLRSHAMKGSFKVHDFVVMPDHIHILITVPGEVTIENAAQLIKGGFSYRAKKELGFEGEIWQKGFSEVGVRDRRNFLEHRRYIEENPVKAGLASSPEDYPYGSKYFKLKIHAENRNEPVSIDQPRQGLKPGTSC
ncbi:MAG: transposase, partial [Terracidiphilus sp.]